MAGKEIGLLASHQLVSTSAFQLVDSLKPDVPAHLPRGCPCLR
jgi:hypothetical protein